MPQPRIVSLLPSATEIVCALGFKDRLVGRSHECDWPPTVTHLPVLTEPKIDPRRSSREINVSVRAIAEERLSVYRLDTEKLKAIRPDIIITQTQCEVCAVSTKDVEDAVRALVDSHPEIVSLKPNTLDDVWQSVIDVATALGAHQTAEDVVTDLKARVEEISKRAHERPEKPAVVVLEWMDPLMAAGHWMPELVARAGGVSIFGETGQPSPWITWDELAASDPDVILISPCGFNIGHSQKDIAALTDNPVWKTLNAVRESKVFIADGHQYFNRPGPRLVESLEILAEICHPGLLNFAHHESGWITV